MKELSERARIFLQEPHYAVLCTHCVDGTLQQTGMCYLLENNTIIMSTVITQQKVRNIELSLWGSLCVIRPYSYVAVGGHVQIIDDQGVAQRDLCRIVERYDEQVATWFAETVQREERVVTLLLPCEHILEYFGTDNTTPTQQRERWIAMPSAN